MKIKLKKVVCLFLAILSTCFCFFCFDFSALAGNINEVPDLSAANAVCVYNINTSVAVIKKNENKIISPGGTVKLMTGILACEMLSNELNTELVITDDMIEEAVGFKIKLKAGMSVTVQDLLYGVLCGSGNDAALAIAKLCAGNTEAFVEMMNSKAQELGMMNTHYTNPTGLDDDNMYTTVSDTITLAEYVSKNQMYMNISSVASYTINSQLTNESLKIFNKNALISNFYAFGYTNPNAYGMSSGATDNSGYCVITYSERNGTAYICAVMGATEDDEHIYSYKITNELLDYVFEKRVFKKLAEKNTLVCSVDVKYVMPDEQGTPVKLNCYIKEDVYALTYRNIDVEKDIEYRYYFHRDELVAPIREGAIVGGVDIVYGDEVIGSTYLFAGGSLEPSGIIYQIDRLKNFFSGPFFIGSAVSFLILCALYFYFFEYNKGRFSPVKKIKKMFRRK